MTMTHRWQHYDTSTKIVSNKEKNKNNKARSAGSLVPDVTLCLFLVVPQSLMVILTGALSYI